MIVKIVLFFIAIVMFGCGGAQEPPKKPFSIKSLSLKNDIVYILDEDSNITLSKRSFNFSNDFQKIKITALPKNGELYINNSLVDENQTILKDNIDNLLYIPKKDFNGNDSFLFEVEIGGKLSKSFEVNFKVLSKNDTPVFDIKAYKKSFEPKVISKDINKSSDIFSIDLNKDGRVDFLTTSQELGEVYWFKNEKDGNFSKHTIASNLTNAYFVKAVDIDQDGDLDIVAGGSDELALFLDQNLTFTKQIIDTNESFNADIKDFDKDGDLDIASVDFHNNKTILYKNENLNFTKEIVDSLLDHPTDIKIYDYDKDDKEDLVVSAFYDGVVCFRQTNSGFSKNIIYDYNYQQGTNYLDIKDGFVYSINYNSNTLLKNDINLLSLLSPTSVKVWDIDNDSDDDIFVSSFSKSYFTWYENTSNGYISHKIDTFAHAKRLSLGDFNLDGDKDVIISLYDEGKIVLFDLKDSLFVDENTLFVTTIKASDIDGDKLTFSLSGEDSSYFNIEQNGSIYFKSKPDFENPKDSDKNNLYDIKVIVSDQKSSISKELRVVVKNLSFFKPVLISQNFQEIKDIALKDSGDIVVADDYDTSLYILKKDNNFTKEQKSLLYDYPQSLAVVDDKIFVGFYDESVVEELDSSWNEKELDSDCSEVQRILKSDINGDGLDDLVVTCGDKIKWFEQNSTNDFIKHDILTSFANYPYDLATLGATHKDILVSVPDDNTIYRLKNDSNESFTKEVFVSNYYVGHLDSDKNITFAYDSNTNEILKITDDKNTTTINNPDNIAYPNSIIITDLDNDGLDDLIVTTKDDEKIIWYKKRVDGSYEERLIAKLNSPIKVLVRDMDGDNKKDLIIACTTKIYILYQRDLENIPIN